MKTNKTKRLEIRLTEEQYAEITKRAKPFQSKANFLMKAVEEFSDSSAVDRMRTNKHLADVYSLMDEKLSHVGGNLNQAMKRINEAAVAGVPYYAIMQRDLMPPVKACYDLLLELRKSTFDVTRDNIKNKKYCN